MFQRSADKLVSLVNGQRFVTSKDNTREVGRFAAGEDLQRSSARGGHCQEAAGSCHTCAVTRFPRPALNAVVISVSGRNSPKCYKGSKYSAKSTWVCEEKCWKTCEVQKKSTILNDGGLNKCEFVCTRFAITVTSADLVCELCVKGGSRKDQTTVEHKWKCDLRNLRRGYSQKVF